MSRPAKDRYIGAWVTPGFMATLDAIAKGAGVSRAEVVRSMIVKAYNSDRATYNSLAEKGGAA